MVVFFCGQDESEVRFAPLPFNVFLTSHLYPFLFSSKRKSALKILKKLKEVYGITIYSYDFYQNFWSLCASQKCFKFLIGWCGDISVVSTPYRKSKTFFWDANWLQKFWKNFMAIYGNKIHIYEFFQNFWSWFALERK